MMADENKKIERLERKVRRERSAREQAEKIAEDGMRRLFLANQELDARVARRTAELDEERAVAARSAAERAEFLRLLSRETRSPLNGVLGVMEVASTNARSEQMRAWLDDGLASAQALQVIMSRLLLFLELEEPHVADPAPIDAMDVLPQRTRVGSTRLSDRVCCWRPSTAARTMVWPSGTGRIWMQFSMRSSPTRSSTGSRACWELLPRTPTEVLCSRSATRVPVLPM